MKKFAWLFVLALSFGQAYGYYNHLGILVGVRELTVSCAFSLSNDTVRITIPKRAHLTGVSSPGMASVNFNNNQNNILIGDVRNSCLGKINVVYTLPVQSSEFSISDWMPVVDEKGVFSATITSPAGQQGMFLPYKNRGRDGYILEPADQPILFSGRFTTVEDHFLGRNFETVYLTRMETSLSNVALQLSGFEKWLFPLQQKHIVLIELPINRDTVRMSGDNLFIVVNSTKKEEINRAFATLYFRTILGWKEDYVSAFTDLYKRLIDGNGSLKRDEAEWIAVPRDDYYLNILKNGFGRTEMDRVGVNDLLGNYALLHFCYYTVGRDPFLAGIRSYLADKREQPEGLDKIFTNSGDAQQAVQFAGTKLLPRAKFIPDLILKGTMVYRSMDLIPDVSVRIGNEMREVVWDNKRTFDLKSADGNISVDPFHLVPQLDFYNDTALADPKAASEKNLVYRSVLQHRHYADETVRGLLDLKVFGMPEGNVFGIEKGVPGYVAIVKFTAPVNSRLMEGLKELVLTVDTNAKVKVLAERIRF